MAKHQPSVTSPDSTTTIWRYMSVHEFVTLMISRQLMFRQFRDLERSDRQEGKIPEGFWESWERLKRQQSPHEDLDQLRNGEERRLDHHRHTQYVSCWNMAEGENALMWMSYAPRGIAIKTTIGKLRGAGFENKHRFGAMNTEAIIYADDWREMENSGIDHHGVVPMRLFLNTKRTLFSPEKEARVRIEPHSTCQTDSDT